MERLKLLGAILLLIVAFGILIGSSRTTGSGPFGDLNASGDAPTLIASDKRPKAPDFQLPEAGTGHIVRLSQAVLTRPVVFSFWATWCGPCRMELPHLEALSKMYQGRVSFYGVNSNDTPTNITAFTHQEGLTLPMLSDAKQTVAMSYGVNSIPMLVMVDRQGRVAYVAQGFDSEMDSYFSKLLDQLIKEG